MKSIWPTKKLTDVCDLERGTEPGSAFYIGVSDKTVPFLRVGDLTGKVDAPKFVKNDNGNLQIVNKNETLITLDGTPGIVVRELKGAIASGIRVVRNIKPEIDESFLFYYLKTPNVQKTIKAYSKGATIIHASAAIPHIKIPLPPLKIQKQIVERLDKIAEAQKLNDELIQKSDDLFQSLLHKELNLAGKNWEVKKLGDLAELVTKGTTPTTYGYQFTNSGTPFLRAEDVYNGAVNYSNVQYHISEETNKFLSRSQTKVNDVLVTIAGTIGRIGYVPKNAPEMNMNQAVAIVRLNKSIDYMYVFFLLQSKEVQRKMFGAQVTGTITNLSLTNIRNFKIPTPSLKTQKQIVEKLSAVQDYKKKLLEQKQKFQELFESVLNKSMK